MKKIKKIHPLKGVLLPAGLTLALAVGAVITTQSFAQSANRARVSEHMFRPEPAILDFSVNENGQTFGSSADSVLPCEFPDLIGVVATNGREGYIYFTDSIDHPSYVPRSMEEQQAMREQGHTVYRTVPVYDVDGRTQIGEFEYSLGMSFYSDTDDPDELLAIIIAMMEEQLSQ
jgi:hypothetical protein